MAKLCHATILVVKPPKHPLLT
ncbi:protein of unknown function [Streptomyces sp. KY75]|nr:protein of unknown function [Streptomyces sp. KY75]CAD5990116.1 protein of unknown function [Streptomyces sp. KY70]